MKELINDYKREGFTLREWLFGALAVAALVCCCALGGFIEKML